MLSLTSQYALRAMIYLAQHADDWPIPGRRIAARAHIPPKYLSKILGDLVRAGLLQATRGVGGGFRMTRPAGRVMLFDVLEPFEQFELRRCPFGNNRCSDADPCLAHRGWKSVVEAQQRFLKRSSVRDIAVKEHTVGRRRQRARQ